MKSERRIDGSWLGGVRTLAPCLVFLLAAGCEFEAIGNGGLPGLGCFKDLYPSQLAIDLTPPIGGLVVGGTNPAPTNDVFHEAGNAFAVQWQYAYDGIYTPGPKKHEYTTRIQIFRLVNPVTDAFELVWETEVDSEPVDVNDEGLDSVTVADGLPYGPYEVRIELDPDDNVPECDDLVTVMNNSATFAFVVYGNNGPPQSPTPCEESEDPDCDDDEGPRGR